VPLSYVGAGTGAAAALWAAATWDDGIAAVVAQGGRPDRAVARLARVRAPTLLIVGGNDEIVHGLNRIARPRLRCPSRLVVIPGATHFFEEPGALDQVAKVTTDWILAHRAPPPPASHSGEDTRP
jgi:pimeloyl-ACP methyl ester carboxylesterase